MSGGRFSVYFKRPRTKSGAVFVLLATAFLAFLISPTWAGPEILPEIARGRAAVLADGALITVEGVQGVVRLAAIQLPDSTPRRKDNSSAIATEAYNALRALIENHLVSVRALPLATDRAGRVLAHLLRDDGVWIEAELVRAGLARVAPTTDTSLLAAELLTFEREARARDRGLWAENTFKIRQADNQQLERDTGTYQIVEGRVLNTAKRGDNIYLNFGVDYRTDFTITVPRANLAAFTAVGIKPLDLTGQKVRARGWITQYHGPTLELTAPAALEMLK